MKKETTFALLIVFVFAVMITFPTRVNAHMLDNWPMYHHDLAHSGVSTSTAPSTNDTLWIYNTRSPIFSSPAVVDGILYIGCDDGNLYALNAYTGALIWAYPTGGAIYSSPAVEYGIVYFLSTDGLVYALDAISGVLIWSVAIGPGSWDWGSPAVHGGNVFIPSSTGWLYSLDAMTGAIVWNTFVGGQPNSMIAVVNGKVYTGTHNFDASNPTLVALDEASGAIIWTYNHTIWHPPTVGMVDCNGVTVMDGDGDGDLEVYFGIYTWNGVGNEAICLDEATGNEVWTYTLGGCSTSTPAVHSGKVFIGSDDGNLYALTADTGAFVWKYQTNDQVWAAPAIADGKVFFGSLDHIFYCLDELSGSLIWSYDTTISRLRGSPAIANGIVFVGNENGKVYAFGMLPEEVIPEVPLGTIMASVVMTIALVAYVAKPKWTRKPM